LIYKFNSKNYYLLTCLLKIDVIESNPNKLADTITNISENSGISLYIKNANINITRQTNHPKTPQILLLENPPESLKNIVFKLALGEIILCS
jgi:hypothetical protein